MSNASSWDFWQTGIFWLKVYLDLRRLERYVPWLRLLIRSFHVFSFTPDLLPSDVLGQERHYEEDGKEFYRFHKGPIFGNIILADEINRAQAKVQAAMLEAMEEQQVTICR